MIVQIENTNMCNAHCKFCAHSQMKRAQTVMEQSVFEKIVTDCSKLSLDGFWMTGLGEPLLDPNIVDRVSYAKQKLRIPIVIYTNGTDLEKYLDVIENLDLLYISLNAVDGVKRKEIMGIDNFEYLKDLILNWNYKCKICVSAICDWGLMEIGEHTQMIEMFGDKLYLHYAANWAGKIFDLKFNPTKACSRIWEFIHILNDGRVALCCLDMEGEVILGNSISEALNGEKLNYYKRMMVAGLRHKLDLCKNCTTV